MPTKMKTGFSRTPPNEFEKGKITNRSQQRATDVENLDRCLRALTLQQRNIFTQNFLRCPKNEERKEMVNQLLERFGKQKLPTAQPKSRPAAQQKSKRERIHKYRITMIKKYVVPPPSTPKASKVKFSQEPPEL